jgi:thymidylate synthase
MIDRYNNLPNKMCYDEGVYVKDTYCKSNLVIKRKLTSIDDINFDDFELENYIPQSYIKAPLLT